MPRRIHRPIAASLAFVTFAVGLAPVMAQQSGPSATAPAAFDPSDVYFQGWLLCNDAEKLSKQGKASEALEKLRRATQLFDTISQSFPEWKKDMVESRRRKVSDAIAEVLPDARREQEKDEQVRSELEGGVLRGGTPDPDGSLLDSGLPVAPIPSTQPVETLASRRIRDLQSQVETLKAQITQGPANGQTDRQRDRAVAELQSARAELDRLRRQTAEAPMQGELDALARRIDKLEAEKAVMGRALDASRKETEEARGQVSALQNERARLLGQIDQIKQELADTQRDLETERAAANQVVAGQLKQIQALQDTIKKKDEQLASAHKTIDNLQSELGELRASYQEVQEERNELLRERDQMAALLNLNKSGQLEAVIDQNLALDRELRETKKRYDALQEDSDASKEDLLEALRDLAISKLRIQEYRRENQEQQQRLNQLQSRLRGEASSVTEHSVSSDEAEMVRGILERQLKIQKKRGEIKDLLMGSLGETAEKDEKIQRALDIFQGSELNLTAEELRVIEGQEVDGVIISPYARPRSEVERSLADLTRELQPYEAAGIRAYKSGRLFAAREAFEIMIDRNPGDVAAMCKLGLVQNQLNEPAAAAEVFRRATELDPKNPYAHRMLGYLMSQLGNHPEAVVELQRAVDLAPTHAESHLLLGNARFQSGDLAGAEDAYKMATSCDPTNAEAHYNLAILLQRLGRKLDAAEAYGKSLQNGATPNPELEKKIGSLPGPETQASEEEPSDSDTPTAPPAEDPPTELTSP
ncbi:putative nucleic acid-binding Zn-ribbon protein [Haloferula luteola]|uniref:Putative nucleic acid-binding Zn-ribbon protein n=1 Tax=Haloferula luteola TaxID=595692 RepID=A0A840V3N3_9BACT|nr:tetratricopeptide repeat protein [Haloferula luteola]MBB5351656.1 putative nucleic acid-binding Zn-ribbon protein [Haloferula luteola]